MSSAAFTRRKFLLSTAAATSSAVFLAACGGGGEEAPPAQSSASAIPQSEIDKAMDTETTLTFWTWVPDIKNQVKLFTDDVPEDQGRPGQRRSGRPALPEAPHGDPVRPGCARRRSDGVPVHPVLHPRRWESARPDALCAGRRSRTITPNGCGARSMSTVGCGASRRTPGRWACCIARTCSPRPASSRRRPTTISPPPPRRTTPRMRRATWSTSPPTRRGRSWPTCGRPVCGRSPSTARRRSRSTWPTRRPRRW